MREYYNIKRLALILAVQAEIEGMKAENIVREQNGLLPAFVEQFYDKSLELLNLANAPDEAL